MTNKIDILKKIELNPDEVYKYNILATSITPLEGLTNVNLTARCIMEELRDWNKKVEKQTALNTLHPSIMYTIDKLPEGLNKYGNISPQMKNEESVFQSLKYLSAHEKNGQGRYIYLYPFLIKNENKVYAKIAMISCPKEAKVETNSYRDSCFGFSREIIDQILINRARHPKSIEEPNPGDQLFSINRSEENWFYPNMGSLEYEIVLLLKKGFAPYPYIPLSDFIHDFIDHAYNNGRIVRILDDYHIILDEPEKDASGEFSKIPEAMSQLMIHVDGLIKFFDRILIPQAKGYGYNRFLSDYEDFRKKYPKNPESPYDISNAFVGELINLSRNFPLTKHSTEVGIKIESAVYTSTKVLEGLLSELVNIATRKDRNKYSNIKEFVIKQIDETTRTKSRLIKIDYKEEFMKNGIKDQDLLNELSDKLKSDIEKLYATEEVTNSQGSTIKYVVDQGYMASVIHNLTSLPEETVKVELDIARKIRDRLKQSNDETLNAKIKPEQVIRLENDSYNIQVQAKELEQEKIIATKYNAPIGIMSFVACTLIFTVIGYYIKSLAILFMGLPIGMATGIFVALNFREKQEVKQKPKSSSNNEKKGPSKEFLEREKNQIELIKLIDMAIFGNQSDKMINKMITEDEMKALVRNKQNQIKSKSKILNEEIDPNDTIRLIEQTITKNSAVLTLPESAIVKGLPSRYFISHTDFKNESFRKKLSDELRNERDRMKMDPQANKYYTFLLNCVEVEYLKFLPKRY
jgi:hypothetical protein